MDINLPDMLGSDATKIIRSLEKEMSNKHTNIVVVSMEGKDAMAENIFDDYCNI